MRRPQAATKAPGLPQDLRLEPEAPGPCDGPLVTELSHPTRCRDSRPDRDSRPNGAIEATALRPQTLANTDAVPVNHTRTRDSDEDTSPPLPPNCDTSEEEEEEEEPCPLPTPIEDEPQPFATLMREAGTGNETDWKEPLASHVPLKEESPTRAALVKEITNQEQATYNAKQMDLEQESGRSKVQAAVPEPEPQPQPGPNKTEQVPVRRWQPPPPGPDSMTAPTASRIDLEKMSQEALAAAAKHSPGALVFTFRLPDGSQKAVDFAPCALNGEQLGLDVQRQAPITVNRTRKGSAADRLGVQPGWVVAFVNDENFEGKDPHFFFATVKKLIQNMNR